MVNINIDDLEDKTITEEKSSTINESNETDLDEFDQILNDIPKQIDNTPEPPIELQDKAYNKKRKNWKKTLQANYFQTRINKILKLKQDYQKTQSEIEKDFIYKPKLKERLGTLILQRNYLRIMILMPNGVMKEYNKPIKTNYVKVSKGRYIIQLKSMIKYRGKNTLFFHYGNPFPIKFDSEKFPYIVDAQSLEQMFNANIVNQIFAGMDGTTKAMLWGFGTLAGVGVLIYLIFLGSTTVLEAGSILIMRGFKNERY